MFGQFQVDSGMILLGRYFVLHLGVVVQACLGIEAAHRRHGYVIIRGSPT